MRIADVPSAFLSRYTDKENTETQDGRLSRCYELGGAAQLNFAIRGWDTTLVHGMIGPQKVPHCWVEFSINGKRLVWDPIMDSCMTWARCRDKLQYRRWTTYNPIEAAKNHIDYGHPGPWGRDDQRYDVEVARIDALQKEHCAPGCTEWNHAENCGWSAMATPAALE